MTAPRYHGITQTDIPVVEEDGRKIHIISGTYDEKTGVRQEPDLAFGEFNEDKFIKR